MFIKLKTHEVVRPFSAKQQRLYTERCNISVEMSQLEHRIKELKEDRATLDEALEPAFRESARRAMPDGTVIERKEISVETKYITEEMVGDVKQQGYSYLRYIASAG